MSPRSRAFLVSGGAAAAAAGLAVAVTLATRTTTPALKARIGCPPHLIAPGEPSAEVAAAVSSTARLAALARRFPRNAFVRLQLGLALYCVRSDAAAISAWRAAVRADPNTPAAVRAQDLLHPDTPIGLPFFVPSFGQARTRWQRVLIRGIAFQNAERPVSAELEFAHAARLAPRQAQAQVAAAVGLYTKDHPERAFGALGPLVRRFPNAQTVRFHLGLLLIFVRGFGQARQELDIAHRQGPQTPLGRQASVLLRSLGQRGTSSPRR